MEPSLLPSRTYAMADDTREATSKSFGFAPLCTEGGDCIIQLSEDRKEDLILPSNVLKKFIYFDQIISGRWPDEQNKVFDEKKKEYVPLYIWGIRHAIDPDDPKKYHHCLEYGVSGDPYTLVKFADLLLFAAIQSEPSLLSDRRLQSHQSEDTPDCAHEVVVKIPDR